MRVPRKKPNLSRSCKTAVSTSEQRKCSSIGGVAQFDLTTPTTEKATTDVSHITAGFVWNSDKNALGVDILYLNKALGSMKPFQTFEGQGTLKVDNKKLLVTWTQKDKADVTLCEFDKQ